MKQSVKDALRNTRLIAYPAKGRPVDQTVAESIANELAPNAEIVALGKTERHRDPGTLTVSLLGDDISRQVLGRVRERWEEPRAAFRLTADSSGALVASHPHLLYPLFCMIKEDWLDEDVRKFINSRTVKPTFLWLRNLNDFFVGSLRKARHFEPEEFVKQLARQGFSHITINGLGVDRPFESGPPGDVYSWFYDYSPDLDQFVDSRLIKGYYPSEYLQTNLNFLKRNAELAIKYGLIPGLHINSPRSMPEEFWSRYGFLRGARIDHPRESFRPRYTLAMAHPAVQQHYRELIQKIMAEVPEIGFIHLWTNDSGSGFEFTTSLYAGRNGGPYLIREWKTEDEIARKAAENVLNYFRLLRDEARKVKPDFRFIADLNPFHVERKHVIPGLGNGIDAGAFGSSEVTTDKKEEKELKEVGALTHVKLDITDNNVLGVPYPKFVYERLKSAASQGKRWILTNTAPRSLAPYDINGEVLRAFHLQRKKPLKDILRETAQRWVGTHYFRTLMDVWELTDSAVRNYPPGIPYSTFAFPWFRLWVRPYVPNIDAIPESEREYYEKFLLATFNNPTRVDLNNDMLWNFLTVIEAGENKEAVDTRVLPPLNKAIAKLVEVLSALPPSAQQRKVFQDLHDRLLALRCYYTTMRNTAAWIETVHGYREARTSKEERQYRVKVWEVVVNELQNAKALLRLWEESTTALMPVSTVGETLHIYAENFGELVRRKVELMRKHMNDEPYIDPNYMWQMPSSYQTH